MSDALKPEKERRLNRVGLSYRCKHCGLPKKGHVCTGKPASDEAEKTKPAKPKVKEAKVVKEPAADDGEVEAKVVEEPAAENGEGESGGAWEASSIFTDIKSVLSNGTTAKTKKRKRTAKETAEPMPGLSEAEKAALQFDAIRPPSLITPEDGEISRSLSSSMSTRSGGPASLLSSFFGAGASNAFSPGTLMSGLGTPAPPLSTPGLSSLSPGGPFFSHGLPSNGLPSAVRELRSAHKRQQTQHAASLGLAVGH